MSRHRGVLKEVTSGDMHLMKRMEGTGPGHPILCEGSQMGDDAWGWMEEPMASSRGSSA